MTLTHDHIALGRALERAARFSQDGSRLAGYSRRDARLFTAVSLPDAWKALKAQERQATMTTAATAAREAK